MTTSNRMRLWLAGAAIFVTTSALSGAAFAAEAGGPSPERLVDPRTGWASLVTALIVFILLLWLLSKFAWGPILKALQSREVKIRTEIENAENARRKADAALSNYEKELARARAEASQMITQAKADAQRVADELRSKNEAELHAMKTRARDEIETAKRQALTDIYGQASVLSTMIAGKILEREVRAEDHSRLIEESLQQLDALKATSGNGQHHN
ncbi:MAG: F0F1 ATP synthase subunit B [Planctomycetota bacterium]